MTPTVKVDSTYEEEFEPDVIHVRVRMEGYGATKQEATKHFNKAYEKLLAALEKVGVNRDEVKNSSFSIWQPWSKKKKRSYEFNASPTFDIDCTEECFDAVWGALMYLDGKDSLVLPYFSYALKDEEGARAKIIHHTVELGRHRAEQLADAVGCDLGQIICIENSLDANSSYRGYSRDLACSAAPGSSSAPQAPVFDPDTIDIDCSVRLEYELKPRA